MEKWFLVLNPFSTFILLIINSSVDVQLFKYVFMLHGRDNLAKMFMPVKLAAHYNEIICRTDRLYVCKYKQYLTMFYFYLVQCKT